MKSVGILLVTHGKMGHYLLDPTDPFPVPATLLTIDEDFGGWAEAATKFFDEENGNLFYPGTVAQIGGTDDIPIESIRDVLNELAFKPYEGKRRFVIVDGVERWKDADVTSELAPGDKLPSVRGLAVESGLNGDLGQHLGKVTQILFGLHVFRSFTGEGFEVFRVHTVYPSLGLG